MNEQEREELSQILTNEPLDVETAPDWFHKGQMRAWDSTKRFVLVIAGTQGGKTVVGVRLLLREIQRTATQGKTNDYLIVGPNTELLKKRAIQLFEEKTHGLANYKQSDKCFVFTPQGARKLAGFDCAIRVFVGYAHDPNSLEAATYRAIWADECGQAGFLRDSWEALQRRAAVFRARIFMTTTPYQATGWLRELHDAAKLGHIDDVEVVNFVSIDNPAFDKREYERMRAELPDWKFQTFYHGVFTRPPGAVFDCFDRRRNVVRAFDVPSHWPRYVGVDFGETNMAAVFLAEDPKDARLYAYDTYHQGGCTIEEHARSILFKARGEVTFGVGGSWGEEEWRRDFGACGLVLARPTVREAEVGIQRLYKQIKEVGLRVFDTCEKLACEIESYSRDVDDRGEPLDTIRDRSKYHRLDALRYIVSAVRPSVTTDTMQRSRLRLSPQRLV